MSAAEHFFDTNVLLYLVSGDSEKADRAENLLAAGGALNVQVLNEFASVAIRKFGMQLDAIRDILATVRSICTVNALDADTHDLGLVLFERHGFSFVDALIVAAALLAGCRFLYTEDMQHGRIVEGLRIHNPFTH